MIEIQPLKKLNASIEIPASKSFMNRSLIVSSLAKGTTTLKNIILCDDTEHMIAGLKKLGVSITGSNTELIIQGTDGTFSPQDDIDLFCGNAGTTVRFITCLASLAKSTVHINGSKRMQQRPLQDLLLPLSQLGVSLSSNQNNGCLPITIQPGGLKGGEITVDCEKSSQYLSSLLMCLPYAKNDTTIRIKGKLSSKPYIDITLAVMKEFGVTIDHNNYKEFFIKSDQRYKAKEYNIEGDASSASYFFAAAAITGGTLRVSGLNPKTTQGDINFLQVLKKMGCKVQIKKDSIEVQGGKLNSVDIDMNSMPDMVQTLAVVASFAEGVTRIRNVGNLTIKETDRLAALKKELQKVGVHAKRMENGLALYPYSLRAATIETYDDHRMAMSFSLFGLKIGGIKITNPECVSKSFPSFFTKFEELYKQEGI